MKAKMICGISCIYNDKSIRIQQSHLIKNEAVPEFCEKLKKAIPYNYKRSAKSWMKEIISHTVLYQLGLFRQHTADTDIEDNEIIFRLLAYAVIYYVYRLCRLLKIEEKLLVRKLHQKEGK